MQNQPSEIQHVIDYTVTAGLTQQQTFTILSALGEGLHRIGVSLAAVDPQNRLQALYDQCLETTLNDRLPDSPRVAALRFRRTLPCRSASGDILQFLFGTGQSEAIPIRWTGDFCALRESQCSQKI